MTYSASGPANPNWKGDDITYSGAHMRVRAVRGSARNQLCGSCGGQAAEWAAPGTSMFSTNPDDYVPMCVKCHRAKDDVINRGWKTRKAVSQ